MPSVCSQSDCSNPSVVNGGLCREHYYSPDEQARRAAIRLSHRPCNICGSDLYGKQSNARTCSPACRQAYYLRDDRAAALALRASRRCIVCSGRIESESGKAQTCSPACRIAHRNQVRDAARETKWQLSKKPCPMCGKDIPPSRRRGSIFCSQACRKKALAERWSQKSPGLMRQYLYGISPEEYERLFQSQGGRCAICRTDQPNGKGFHLDHDHATGAIRGILCSSCNNGLGRFRDDPAHLQAAIAYLAR